MLPRRYKIVPKTTITRETLSTVWQLQNSKFDDGVAVQDPDRVPDKFGPHIKNVMGLSFDYLKNQVCSLGWRIRLLPPYRELLSQAFARFFMRVGLPVDIPSFK